MTDFHVQRLLLDRLVQGKHILSTGVLVRYQFLAVLFSPNFDFWEMCWKFFKLRYSYIIVISFPENLKQWIPSTEYLYFISFKWCLLFWISYRVYLLNPVLFPGIFLLLCVYKFLNIFSFNICGLVVLHLILLILFFRSIHFLFECIANSLVQFRIRASYLEVYNEKVKYF